MTPINDDTALWVPFFAAAGIRIGWWFGGTIIAAFQWLGKRI